MAQHACRLPKVFIRRRVPEISHDTTIAEPVCASKYNLGVGTVVFFLFGELQAGVQLVGARQLGLYSKSDCKFTSRGRGAFDVEADAFDVE